MRILRGIDTIRCGDGSSLLLCLDAARPQAALSSMAGQAQAVYLDPPFMTGEDFKRRRPFGEEGWQKGKPAVDYPAYSDRFEGLPDYLAFLRGLVQQAQRLLTPSGVLCLHVDWRVSHHARLLCEELFGTDCFINEIIWAYESGGRGVRNFSRKHDTILMFGRTPEYRFNIKNVPIPRQGVRRNHLKRGVDENGRAYGSVRVGGKEYRYYDDEPTYPGDVWTDLSHLQQRDPERTGYPTQKPLRLIDRLLRPLVEPGDLVADLCCGSGAALAAARALGCRFLGADISPEALVTAALRLNMHDLTLSVPDSGDEAALSASSRGDAVFLSGYQAAHRDWPRDYGPLDALECWACGRVAEGVFSAGDMLRRTGRAPSLPMMSFLPAGEGLPAVLTIDAAGRKKIWALEEEASP